MTVGKWLGVFWGLETPRALSVRAPQDGRVTCGPRVQPERKGWEGGGGGGGEGRRAKVAIAQ